jgi:hypothetical protein
MKKYQNTDILVNNCCMGVFALYKEVGTVNAGKADTLQAAKEEQLAFAIVIMRNLPVYGRASEMTESPGRCLRPFGTANSPASAQGLRFRSRYDWKPW